MQVNLALMSANTTNQVRDTVKFGYDTVVYASASVAKTQKLFGSSQTKKPDALQNIQFPAPANEPRNILAVMALPFVAFAALEALGSTKEALASFLTNVVCNFKVNGTPVYTMLLQTLLPVNVTYLVEGDLIVITQKEKPYTAFAEPIGVPGGANFDLEVEVPTGLDFTTPASAVTNPHLPVGSHTNVSATGRCFYIKFFIAYQSQQVVANV
ncbi:MAG: hypothetical protein JNL32_00220 [Candidatus Kapabacteria bacterium]|nr:hypothetical protein [Candidatus Kapabacteria bacterium]